MNLGTIVKTARSKRRMNQTELAEIGDRFAPEQHRERLGA